MVYKAIVRDAMAWDAIPLYGWIPRHYGEPMAHYREPIAHCAEPGAHSGEPCRVCRGWGPR